MYVVSNFNVFVCSACAGIHREMTHKVKGISMCVFSEQELQDLTTYGNLVSSRRSLTPTEPTSTPDEELEGLEAPHPRQDRHPQNEGVLPLEVHGEALRRRGGRRRLERGL